MRTVEILEKINQHSFEMLKFGETKNATLIAFNGALIIGMAKIASETSSQLLFYYLMYVILMSGISIYISLCSLIAKIRHTTNDISLPRSKNMLFFATVAHLSANELLEKIKVQYECESANANHENDLAMQAIVTSQIASRKFKLFNIAIAFTFSGISTPFGLIIYKAFLDHDR